MHKPPLTEVTWRTLDAVTLFDATYAVGVLRAPVVRAVVACARLALPAVRPIAEAWRAVDALDGVDALLDGRGTAGGVSTSGAMVGAFCGHADAIIYATYAASATNVGEYARHVVIATTVDSVDVAMEVAGRAWSGGLRGAVRSEVGRRMAEIVRKHIPWATYAAALDRR